MTLTPHSMTTALLIIDVQQALCTGEYAAIASEQLIERINTVSRKARSAGILVVIVQHEAADGPLKYGTEGWNLARGLAALTTDTYVRKQASDAFHQTNLHALLQANDVGNLVVCGLQSEFCVDSTIRRALALGYPVTLVADSHSTMDNGVLSAAQISAHHNETLVNLTSFGPRVTLQLAGELFLKAYR